MNTLELIRDYLVEQGHNIDDRDNSVSFLNNYTNSASLYINIIEENDEVPTDQLSKLQLQITINDTTIKGNRSGWYPRERIYVTFVTLISISDIIHPDSFEKLDQWIEDATQEFNDKIKTLPKTQELFDKERSGPPSSDFTWVHLDYHGSMGRYTTTSIEPTKITTDSATSNE